MGVKLFSNCCGWMVKNGQQTDFESAGSRRRYEDTLVWREDRKRNFIVKLYHSSLCVDSKYGALNLL